MALRKCLCAAFVLNSGPGEINYLLPVSLLSFQFKNVQIFCHSRKKVQPEYHQEPKNLDFLCAFNSGNQRAGPPVCAKQSSRACFEVFQIALHCGQPKTDLNMMGIHNKINGSYTGSCFLYGNNSTLKLESSSPSGLRWSPLSLGQLSRVSR